MQPIISKSILKAATNQQKCQLMKMVIKGIARYK